MTDFFADLEEELRSAHPRRPRPVVPVRAAVVTAAVLVAVAVALGTLAPSAEREVAAPSPSPAEEGWTAYAPLDCGGSGRVVDGTIPDEFVDRFAILRGDVEPATLPDDRLPPYVAEVVRQSIRPIAGPADSKYAFFVARVYDDDCRPAAVNVCLISIDANDGVCADPGERTVEESFVREARDGRQIEALLAEDAAERVEGNVGFEILEERPQSITPLDCAGQPEMGPLKERYAIFREPPAKETDGIEMALPDGYRNVYLTEARRSGDHVVFPASDANCGTGVCLVRMGSEKTACGAPSRAERAVEPVLVEDDRFAALVADGVRTLTVATDQGNRRFEVDGSVVEGALRGEFLGIYSGS